MPSPPGHFASARSSQNAHPSRHGATWGSSQTPTHRDMGNLGARASCPRTRRKARLLALHCTIAFKLSNSFARKPCAKDVLMRIPSTPPSYRDLLRSIASERLPAFAAAVAEEDRYLHWDELRFRTPPGDLSVEEWWVATKLARASARPPVAVSGRYRPRLLLHRTRPPLPHPARSRSRHRGAARQLASGARQRRRPLRQSHAIAGGGSHPFQPARGCGHHPQGREGDAAHRSPPQRTPASG